MIKILSLNEWKESPNYLFDKWFFSKKTEIEKTFVENNDGLEYDYFEYDSDSYGDVHVAFIFFNEEEYQWKIELQVDASTLNDDDEIEECNLNLHCYDIETSETLGLIERKGIKPDELTSDYILQFINDFKSEKIKQEQPEEVAESKINANDKIKIHGILTMNLELRGQEEIYSDIRSLMGVTIFKTKDLLEKDKYSTNKNINQQPKNRYAIGATVKIDKYPYFNQSEENFTIDDFIKEINKIPGIISFVINRNKM